MSLRVLHILGTAQFEGTGIANTVATLAREMRARNVATAAWFLTSDGPLIDLLREAGVQAEFIPWLPSPRDPRGALRFYRRLVQEEYSVIHQHFGGPRVRWLARRAGARCIVVHLWSRIEETPKPKFVTLSTRWSDAVIATSKAVAAQSDAAYVNVIYPGVPVRQPEDRGILGTGRIGSAGRLIHFKGMHLLVEALAVVRREFPQARLEVAGSGPALEEIRNTARRFDVECAVDLPGWRADLGAFHRNLDIYAQPSLEEGFGIGILEAMAAGIPVIATAAGGPAEFIENGVNGILVGPNPSAISEAILLLLRNRALMESIAREGRRTVEQRFSPARMVQQVMDVYERALRAAGGEAQLDDVAATIAPD